MLNILSKHRIVTVVLHDIIMCLSFSKLKGV